MNKIIGILAGAGILLGVFSVPVSTQARAGNTSSSEELIQTMNQQIAELMKQIQELTVQLDSLKKAKGEVKKAVKEVEATIRITSQLRIGMNNEDITLLQEVLATDPEVYPEGLITGYFGPLTERAVKRFQKRMGVEQVGVVGPKTLSKINELLEEGAGASGKVPPGLLVSPGISKKLGYVPQPPSDQKLPPGISKKLSEEEEEEEEEEEDIVAPIISVIAASSTTASSTKITWTTDEDANSKVWYDTSTPLVIATSTFMVSSSELTVDHDLTLTDLTASTTYYYLVISADASDNIATSSEELFTTLSE
ncbi:peptidoglycan-binding protein [Candidatus Parcubacteria bacterium]|nr:peptidoglycan-binding protein [Candidatus Parcubacteria bacterium]